MQKLWSTPRDEETEDMLGDITAKGSDVIASFLSDADGLEVQGSEEEGYDYDGSGDTMPIQEVDRHDGSGDRTESGQVYILVKPVLTS